MPIEEVHKWTRRDIIPHYIFCWSTITALTLAAYTMKKFTKILESAQFEVALRNVNLHTEFIVYDNFNFISFLFLCHLYIVNVMRKVI